MDNVVLDPNAFTAQGKGWTVEREFATDITVTRSGAEQRVQRWLIGRRRYTVPYQLMSQVQIRDFRVFFVLRGGSNRSFLMWDPTDCYVGSASQIGTGDASNKDFQLGIAYADGANSVFEPVLHPVPAGTTIPVNLLGAIGWTVTNLTTFNTVKVNGALMVEGTDYTINTSTGVISFVAAPGTGQAVTWQGWRYMAVRFDGDKFSLEYTNIVGGMNPDLIEVLGE